MVSKLVTSLASIDTDPQLIIKGASLHREFGPSVSVLNGVDLDVYAGEVLALTGRSGSGKSTLLNLLGLLDRPSSGTGELLGQDCSNATQSRLSTSTLRPAGAGLEAVGQPGLRRLKDRGEDADTCCRSPLVMPSSPPLATSLRHNITSLHAWSDLFLSTSRRRRFALKLWAVSFGSYLLYSALLALQVGIGFASAPAVGAFLSCVLVANLGFYAVIRSGFVERRGLEATAAATQLVAGVVAMWANYAMVGPAAPATTIIVASHVVYASFSMTASQVRRLTFFSLSGLGGVMVLCHLWQPERYPANIQLVAFMYALLVIPLTAVLARSVATMQLKLRDRSRELRDALTQVRELATKDGLTGLHNRRHMTDLLEELLGGHAASGTPVSVALLDIDLFKSINDRFGHAAGDTVLRRFARSAQACLRDSDVIARWGGEEFLIAFPGTSPASAGRTLARFHASLGDLELDDAAPGLTLTFSAGLTQAIPNESIDDLVERADQAMYRAKAAGRDQDVLDDPQALTTLSLTASQPTRPPLGLDG